MLCYIILKEMLIFQAQVSVVDVAATAVKATRLTPEEAVIVTLTDPLEEEVTETMHQETAATDPEEVVNETLTAAEVVEVTTDARRSASTAAEVRTVETTDEMTEMLDETATDRETTVRAAVMLQERHTDLEKTESKCHVSSSWTL